MGTLYQYFPGKEALLYALVGRGLDRAATAVEAACQMSGHLSLEKCSDAFVNAYIDAKTGDPDTSRALYHASAELNIKDLSDKLIDRLHRAARGLLLCARDSRFEDIDGVVFSWVAVVTGGTRQIFDQEGTVARLPIFREQLLKMSRAYLKAVKDRLS